MQQNALMIGVVTLIAVMLTAGGFFLAMAVRRWVRSDPADETPFTLQDLREMRDRGELTPAEYEALRAEMIGKAGGSIPRDHS
jgi:uncharacterized membrane protein